MQTKTDQIRAAWLAGDQIGALRIAAQFFDRSEDTRAFKRGMDANNHPSFYRWGKHASVLSIILEQFPGLNLQPLCDPRNIVD
jgi:hypothetical protein